MDDQTYFMMLVGEPYLYGNPGNITVMTKLNEKQFNKSMCECEKGFLVKYPQYIPSAKSWLWIIYKYICKQNIDATIDCLNELINAGNPNSPRTPPL